MLNLVWNDGEMPVPKAFLSGLELFKGNPQLLEHREYRVKRQRGHARVCGATLRREVAFLRH